MLELDGILIFRVVLSVTGFLVLMGAVYFNPRPGRNDLPKNIQDATPPPSKREKLQALGFGIPYLPLVILVPLLSGLTLDAPDGDRERSSRVMRSVGHVSGATPCGRSRGHIARRS